MSVHPGRFVPRLLSVNALRIPQQLVERFVYQRDELCQCQQQRQSQQQQRFQQQWGRSLILSKRVSHPVNGPDQVSRGAERSALVGRRKQPSGQPIWAVELNLHGDTNVRTLLAWRLCVLQPFHARMVTRVEPARYNNPVHHAKRRLNPAK